MADDDRRVTYSYRPLLYRSLGRWTMVLALVDPAWLRLGAYIGFHDPEVHLYALWLYIGASRRRQEDS